MKSSESGSLPLDRSEISTDDLDAKLVRRLAFISRPTDLPFFLAPIIADQVWSQRGEQFSLVFAYPGLSEDRVHAAERMIASSPCEAVLLRSGEGQGSLLLALGYSPKTRKTIAHWKDSVERFSQEPLAHRDVTPFEGGALFSSVCDAIFSLRAPSDFHVNFRSPELSPIPVVGNDLIRGAILYEMPWSESLRDDPVQNAVQALNQPAAGVQQDAGCLITELMAFVRRQRPDLLKAFDIKDPSSRAGYVDWFLTRAELELELSAEYVDPVRAARSEGDNATHAGSITPPIKAVPNYSQGLTLIGYPRAEMGMGEQIRSCAASLWATRSQFCLFDFKFGILASQRHYEYDQFICPDNPFPTNLFHINADQIPLALEKLGAEFFRNKYNIGYWEWELSRFPDLWMPSVDKVDEIWAPSKFIQAAISQRTSKPVLWMPLAVEGPVPIENAAVTRQQFGLPQDKFLFLFSFDFSSFATRKNFRAALEAFRRAFPREQSVGLVFKVIRHAHHKHELWEIIRETADDDRILLIDRVLRQNQMRALTACCDAYLSLHRSEGFGLSIAEAMYLGKPVVVTNYSGNIDFTLPENSCLVDYKLIPVKDGEYVFSEGQVWADPDIDQAAGYMQQLVADREYGARLGRTAASFMRKHHSYKAIGNRYAKRLQQIEAARKILAPVTDERESIVRNLVETFRLPRNLA